MKIFVFIFMLIKSNSQNVFFFKCEKTFTNENLYINCNEQNENNSTNYNLTFQDLTDKKLGIKLKGNDYLKLLHSLQFFQTLSLDLSSNQNDFETYFKKINKLIDLQSLNLSHNEILIL